VRHPGAPLLILLLAVTGGCERAQQAEGDNQTVTTDVPRAAAEQSGVTPMAERVAVLGLLNKRNGIVRDLTLRPGQAMRVKDVVVRLRACEATAPWEAEKLTGAFVQVDRLRSDGQWVRRFSGWIYKESPSLNVVEDAVYDVWPKSCAMSWPAGPDAPASPARSSSPSRASNSGGGSSAADAPAAGNDAAPTDSVEPAAPPPPEESADDNIPT